MKIYHNYKHDNNMTFFVKDIKYKIIIKIITLYDGSLKTIGVI